MARSNRALHDQLPAAVCAFSAARVALPAAPASLALAATLLLAPLLAACYGDDAASEGDQGASVPAVEAVEARFGEVALEQRLSGVVKARNQVAIHSETSARVLEVLVRSGDAVERGQPLVRLDASLLRDQVNQAEANTRAAQAQTREAQARIAELEAQVRRSRVLVDQNLISDLELETQEAQLDAARAAAEQAAAGVEQATASLQERQTTLDRSVLRAPVTGHVGQRTVEVGMVVDPGTVLFVIGNLDELRVEVSLTQSMLGFLREGQPVLVSAPALGEDAVPGTLARISPFLSAGSFSTVGEIDIANPGDRLRPGMFVTVDVLYGESEPATQVPASALWEDPASGVEGVFVAASAAASAAAAAPAPAAATAAGAAASDEQTGETVGLERTVAFRPVEVLNEGSASAAVRGVDEGEWVVTVGQHLLRADEPMIARVHATTWERVLDLEALQREDVLRDFLAKQREAARTLGARPPTLDERLGAPGSTATDP